MDFERNPFALKNVSVIRLTFVWFAHFSPVLASQTNTDFSSSRVPMTKWKVFPSFQVSVLRVLVTKNNITLPRSCRSKWQKEILPFKTHPAYHLEFRQLQFFLGFVHQIYWITHKARNKFRRIVCAFIATGHLKVWQLCDWTFLVGVVVPRSAAVCWRNRKTNDRECTIDE